MFTKLILNDKAVLPEHEDEETPQDRQTIRKFWTHPVLQGLGIRRENSRSVRRQVHVLIVGPDVAALGHVANDLGDVEGPMLCLGAISWTELINNEGPAHVR